MLTFSIGEHINNVKLIWSICGTYINRNKKCVRWLYSSVHWRKSKLFWLDCVSFKINVKLFNWYKSTSKNDDSNNLFIYQIKLFLNNKIQKCQDVCHSSFLLSSQSTKAEEMHYIYACRYLKKILIASKERFFNNEHILRFFE